MCVGLLGLDASRLSTMLEYTNKGEGRRCLEHGQVAEFLLLGELVNRSSSKW